MYVLKAQIGVEVFNHAYGYNSDYPSLNRCLLIAHFSNAFLC